jgi:hypothetical protein
MIGWQRNRDIVSNTTMKDLRYTLLCDGSSDKILIYILNWLLKEHLPGCVIQHEWADLTRSQDPDRKTLEGRIRLSLDQYPCDLLFIHRDAEKESREMRVQEIQQALAKTEIYTPPAVCIIPIRMIEAWLLFDLAAIRKAAGNPNGTRKLAVPAWSRIEREPNPKRVLSDLLRQASELGSTRLKKFKKREVPSSVHRVAELIEDFSPLRQLTAFQSLESELLAVLKEKGWMD